jgi:hypothetical protein
MNRGEGSAGVVRAINVTIPEHGQLLRFQRPVVVRRVNDDLMRANSVHAVVDAFRLGKQPNLAFGLGAETPGLGALGLRPGMVADDFVMQFALPQRCAIEPPPAVA